MDEVGFASLGVDWRRGAVNFIGSQGRTTRLKPIARHAVLYFIEQGLLPKTGKGCEWEVDCNAGPVMLAFNVTEEKVRADL